MKNHSAYTPLDELPAAGAVSTDLLRVKPHAPGRKRETVEIAYLKPLVAAFDDRLTCPRGNIVFRRSNIRLVFGKQQ